MRIKMHINKWKRKYLEEKAKSDALKSNLDELRLLNEALEDKMSALEGLCDTQKKALTIIFDLYQSRVNERDLLKKELDELRRGSTPEKNDIPWPEDDFEKTLGTDANVSLSGDDTEPFFEGSDKEV